MSAVEQVGKLTPQHVAYAAELLRRMPEALRLAARDPLGARAVVLGLLLPHNPAARDAVLRKAPVDPHVRDLLDDLRPDLALVDDAMRLPLVDIALPALRRLTRGEYERFTADVGLLVLSDERVELFEWLLQRLILRHLAPHFAAKAKPPTRVRYATMHAVLDPVATLLSALAQPGARSRDASAAYAAGWQGLGTSAPLKEPQHCGLPAVDAALETLASASGALKKRILEGCARCIAADREVTAREAELLRGIADALDCPMPPLLPGQPLV